MSYSDLKALITKKLQHISFVLYLTPPRAMKLRITKLKAAF